MADDDPETTAVGDMGKRLGLLGGQDQILRLGAGKGCIAVADVIVIAARCSRCSTSSMSRLVKRSPPRTSYPCATGSGALRMAPSTASNWPGPSLKRYAQAAMSRRVKVAYCRVMASSARLGSAMIRGPFSRAMARFISARSASSPARTTRCAGAPILSCGSSAMPCALRLR